MKALHHKVNIIPIIAKADALTTEELIQMKQIVFEKSSKRQIRINFIFRFSNKLKKFIDHDEKQKELIQEKGNEVNY
jgi:septin family protein